MQAWQRRTPSCSFPHSVWISATRRSSFSPQSTKRPLAPHVNIVGVPLHMPYQAISKQDAGQRKRWLSAFPIIASFLSPNSDIFPTPPSRYHQPTLHNSCLPRSNAATDQDRRRELLGMQGAQSHLRLDPPSMRQVHEDWEAMRLWQSEAAMDRLCGIARAARWEEDPLVSSASLAEDHRLPYDVLRK